MNATNELGFGEDCQRKSIVPNPGQVDVATTEYLSYSVTARGAKPVFAFVSKNKRLTADQFDGHPRKQYDWDWGKNSGEKDGKREDHQVRFDFSGTLEYTLKVDKKRIGIGPNAADQVVGTVLEIEYKCKSTQTTVFPETFAVRLV